MGICKLTVMLKKTNGNMTKFCIYTKDKKFHLTDNKIYSFGFILLIPLFIRMFIFKNQNFSILEIGLLWFSLGILIISLFLNLTSFFRYVPLEGKLEGELILNEKEIIIDKTTLNIENIKNLKITNDDFYDFVAPYRSYFILGRKSNGVNNEIKIFLKNGKEYVINYQQDDNHDMQNSKELLKHYYSKGIIELENLLYVLAIVDETEKNEFKRTLK